MTAGFIVAALLLCGMVLLVAEVAILPGFGIAGVSALLLISGAVVYAWSRFGPAWGVGSLVLAAVVTIAAVVIAPRTRAGKDLLLSTDLKEAATGAPRELVGKEGITLTVLRPTGVAEIEGQRIDVVADGIFVEPNQRIRVVAVDGPRVVVEPIQKEA